MDQSVRVLAVTAEAAVREALRRVAAAADAVLDECDALSRHHWSRAQVVVLDAVAATRCLEDGLPRRPGVILVCEGAATLADWRCAASLGAERVLELPAQESILVGLLGRRPDARAGDGAVVAVAGGRGGGGASTFAAALALTAVESWPHTLLVDGDANGGGVDLLLGIEKSAGMRWPGLVLESGRVQAEALHTALPQVDGVAVLACGRGSQARPPQRGAVGAVLESCRGAGDLVVCDVPRGGDVETFFAAADLVVLVVPAELRACAAAEAFAVQAAAVNPNVGAVVRGPAPGGLTAAEVAAAVGIPLLASMRPHAGLAEQLDRGGLRIGRTSPLRKAASTVLATLDKRPVASTWVAA